MLQCLLEKTVVDNFYARFDQGCGNTMPDLSDPFHSGQVENFYLLVLGQVQMYKDDKILYFIF